MADAEDGLAELQAAASELVQSSVRWWGPTRQMGWDDVFSDPRKFVARSVFWRQVDGLRAVTLLAEAGLGHPALSQVRLACDEYLWMRYLSTLTADECRTLLPLLGMRETDLIVLAQQQFAGKAGMKSLGFAPSFVRRTDQHRRIADAALRKVAVDLNWPGSGDASALAFPSMDWIATRASEHALYAFLYAATSKGVHFSMSEYYRRTWGEPGRTATVAGDGIYNRYRAAFALYWCCYIFVKVMATAGDVMEADLVEPEDEAAEGWTRAVERFASHGRVPIITDEEMKLAEPGRTDL